MGAESLGHRVLSITATLLFREKPSMWGDGMMGARRSAHSFFVVFFVLKLLNVFLYEA